jgi:filamentous hemagglutinin
LRPPFSQTSVDRVAGLYVANPNGILAASAGRDLNLTGAIVANGVPSAGKDASLTQLTAGRSVNLASVTTAQSESIVWDAKNSRSQASSQEVGTTITGGGNLVIQAGLTDKTGDLNARAATIEQGGAAQLSAARDINLTAGQATSSFAEAHSQTSKGFLSSKSTTTRDTINTTTAQGTSIGGNTVSLVAGNNLTAQGASIISDAGTALRAGNNITLTTAQNTRDESHFSQTKKSGFTALQGGGINVGYSKNSSATTRSASATTQTGTTVASIGGDVSIQAGNTYTQTGSDILTPAGNIDITAKRVDITEARETSVQSACPQADIL